jgi:hypothetical protein
MKRKILGVLGGLCGLCENPGLEIIRLAPSKKISHKDHKEHQELRFPELNLMYETSPKFARKGPAISPGLAHLLAVVLRLICDE